MEQNLKKCFFINRSLNFNLNLLQYSAHKFSQKLAKLLHCSSQPFVPTCCNWQFSVLQGAFLKHPAENIGPLTAAPEFYLHVRQYFVLAKN